MRTLGERLARGDVMILDGGTGTELQRRGVPMDGVAWSAAAMLHHGDTLREIPADYIRAGAVIITTNIFAAARHVLVPAGLGDRVRELNRTAVALARDARDRPAGGRDVRIAGSISTMARAPTTRDGLMRPRLALTTWSRPRSWPRRAWTSSSSR
jgi:S-methylmethionine-dependent homocysteine/selenocysteine methylase